MRIGFVGCGAIGSCYASYLSRKHEVCVLDTYAPVIESIKKNGILLDECAPGSGTGETVSFRPAMATTDPKEIGVVDLLIVFVHYQYGGRRAQRSAHDRPAHHDPVPAERPGQL